MLRRCCGVGGITRARDGRAAVAPAAVAPGLLGWSAGDGNYGATDALLPLRLLLPVLLHPTRATQPRKSDMPGACQQSRGKLAGLHRGAGMASLKQRSKPQRHRHWCHAQMDRDSSNTTREPRAVLEPGPRRMPPSKIMVPNWGHRDDPGMTRLHLQGVCGSEIGRPALHAVHPLRLAQKLQMHRMECPGVATEAWGCACTRSLESARGIVSRRSTRGIEGRQP